MSVADLLEVLSVLIICSVVGFKWGLMERVADDFLTESMS